MFRQLKASSTIILLLLVLLRCADGSRSLKTSRGEGEIESVRVDIADERVLRMFNLTSDQLKRLTQGVSTVKSGSTSTSTDNEGMNFRRNFRIGDIRNKIEMAISGGGTPPSDNKDQPHHEMAAYPICTSETTWLDDPNVTLRFRDNLFEPRKNNLYLDRAILRIYKLNPTNSMLQSTEHPKACPDTSIDAQIRITVSIITRNKNRREKRKRICNSFMMNVSHTGWIEIDVKRAIHIWENVDQQRANPPVVGHFMLEVHDEEERPLNPGHFFGPPLCDQADHAIPWNVYGSYSAMPLPYSGQVPRSPRIDITLIGYAGTMPRTRHGLNSDHELYRLSNRKREEPTTSITPTDNLLDQSSSTEIHRHRQRHARHHHHHAHNSPPATSVDGDTADPTVATGSIRLDTSVEDRQTLDC